MELDQQQDAITNYYEILEINPQASGHDVHQAYLRVKKTYSLRNPDIFKSFTFDEIQDLLTLIEEAYATLGNEETREIYDARLFEKHPELKTEPIAQDFIESDENPDGNTEESETIPAGWEKTALSTYPIDESFEVLIQSQEFYDGIFLGKVRKYKRVKLEDFSQHTCITIKYLYAIEDNNYLALPAPVFVRGYIHQYCKLLGLDVDKVATSFMKLYSNGRE